MKFNEMNEWVNECNDMKLHGMIWHEIKWNENDMTLNEGMNWNEMKSDENWHEIKSKLSENKCK